MQPQNHLIEWQTLCSARDKIAAFRFIQEALNNAYEHAEGVEQAVTCRYENQVFELEVKDGGPGLKQSETVANESGLGLVGLRQRIESLGGTFVITSEPGKGTTLKMQCDLREKSDAISA